MRILLDEDSVHETLAALLRKDGHDVKSSMEAGLAGRSDAVQLVHAIRERRLLLSKNHADFEDLHDLIAAASGHHPGILVVRLDNDSRRDMTPRGIANAIRKLEQSGATLIDEFHILNHWR